MRILWIEDQPLENQDYWSLMLTRGDTVQSVRTVEEALQALQSDLFDVILLDLKIPLGDGPSVDSLSDTDYNGRYVLDAVREEGLAAVSRIICLTNYAPAAKSLGSGLKMRVLSKSAFLNDFTRVLYD